MTLFARVPQVPGVVAEVYTGDALFPMTPDFAATWHVAPPGTQQGYTFDGATFAPPAAQAAQAKAERNAALVLQLAAIDSKKARAASDAILSGDHTRLQALEAQAAALRVQFES